MNNISKPKIGILLLIIITLFTFCGCDLVGRAGQLTKEMQLEAPKINDMSKEILRCFKESDKEGLKKLFCEKIRNEPDFDQKISEAFVYLKGRISSYDIDTSAGGGKSTSHGKVTAWDVAPEIRYISTLEEIVPEPTGGRLFERIYDIYYRWGIVNDEDKSLEGLQMITITLLNIDKFTIGYNINAKAVSTQQN